MAKSFWPPGPNDFAVRTAALPILKEDLEMDAVELIGCSNDWGGAAGICSPTGGDINYSSMSRQFHMKACAVLSIYGGCLGAEACCIRQRQRWGRQDSHLAK